jgi:hypothetical protein
MMTDSTTIGVTTAEGSLLEQDVYSQNSTSCDRRLSRAARTLIQRHVLRALSLSAQEESDVWTLLDQWIGKAPPTCPLLPTRDVLRQDEEHSLMITPPSKNLNWAYPTHILQHRRQSSPLRPKEWCQCGYCGKTFVTRFYLDMHVMHQHHYSSAEEASMICPATEWCHVVGLANCHQQALEDEPYYDRGSGGWGEDRKSVKHKWTKVTHSISCDLESMEADCRSVLETCGVSGDFCDSMTCPTHHFLWHLPDHWQDTWLQEAQHHPGLLGILLVIGIFIWVYAMAASSWTASFVNSKPHPPGKRLLQKSSRPRSSRPLFKRSKRD